MNQFRAPTSTLSERILLMSVPVDVEELIQVHHEVEALEEYAQEGWSWVDDVCEWLGCGVGGVFEIKERIQTLEDQLEAYRALDSDDFIDAEEAFTRLEVSDLGDNRTAGRAYYKPRPLIAPKIHGRRSAHDLYDDVD